VSALQQPHEVTTRALTNTVLSSAYQPDHVHKAYEHRSSFHRAGTARTSTLLTTRATCPIPLTVVSSQSSQLVRRSTAEQCHVLSTVADSGDCPTSHPVKLMTLFYEFVYATGNLKKSSSGRSSLVLANGEFASLPRNSRR
jgi:hypothetical protein